MIYAHDNPSFPDHPAHADIVEKFIAWSKKLSFDVDSDRSPHGYVPGRGVQIDGASNDILTTQLSLLPPDWDDKNVRYVVVFGSRLLEKYIQDEHQRNFDDGKTYIETIVDTCQEFDRTEWDPTSTDEKERFRKKVFDRVRDTQTRLIPKMGNTFHHVLTELAFVKFRMNRQTTPRVIPISLDENSTPSFIASGPNLLRVENVGQHNIYKSFFNILLRFEHHEEDRPFVEAMRKCFEECRGLASDSTLATQVQYDSRCEESVLNTLRKLVDSPEYNNIQRSVTIEDIRRILSMHTFLDRSSIQRISGDSLPTEIRDIDLVRKGQLQPISIEALFDERVIERERMSPKRILIRGLPGVGKSTLSRRIMYADNWYEIPVIKRDLVIRLPLRKLQYSSNLEELLFDEFFKLVPRGSDCAAQLNDWILNKECEHKIIFILDGLDEVQGWPTQKRGLLLELLNRPNCIITSRFSNNTIGMDPIDLELEALGLSTESINAYLRSTEIITPEDAEAVRNFIENDNKIQEMARVPIYLDILCYSWDEINKQGHYASHSSIDDQPRPPTTTDFYQAITHKLWRKDILNLGKTDHGERLTSDIVDAIRDPRRLLKRVVQADIDLLAEIAANILSQGRFEFTGRDVDAAIKKLEVNGRQLPLRLETDLAKLSFLRRDSNSSHQQNYRFVHITFQEFFAAQYIIRDRDTLERQMRKHKYNHHYEIVWRFVAGLLALTPRKQFGPNDFFDLLEQEPRDLTGIKHVYLMMSCLRECRGLLDNTRQDALDAALTEWLDLEVDAGRDTSRRLLISNDVAFPEAILGKKVEQQLNEGKYGIVQSLSRPNLSDEFADWLVSNTGMYNHLEAPHYMFSRARIPRKAGEKLLRLLEHDELKDPYIVFWILESGTLHEGTIAEMLEVLDPSEKNQGLCRIYLKVLNNQRKLPSIAIQKIWDFQVGRLDYPYEMINNLVNPLDAETINKVRNDLEKIQDPARRFMIGKYLRSRPEFREYFRTWIPAALDILENASVDEHDKYSALSFIKDFSPDKKPYQCLIAQLLSHDNPFLRGKATDILRE
ncbi:hypothetical protein GGR52DRAFT_471296 [Hypoxylon sp. FL1284]|nr:hypothetical protein GGR52DRAFT_471296 [Hypoxylon sp. FL1284]